jgi:BMFP domain-containing protein YqiC
MAKSEKLLKLLSSFVESGILTSQDVKREMLTNLQFKKDQIVNKLDLVSRQEFEILKKIVNKQNKEITRLSKKTKKVK